MTDQAEWDETQKLENAVRGRLQEERADLEAIPLIAVEDAHEWAACAQVLAAAIAQGYAAEAAIDVMRRFRDLLHTTPEPEK